MKNIYYVYILRSLKDGWLYTGYTKDLDERLARHNANKMKATRKRGPFIIVYHEEYPSRSKALKREKFLKTGVGRRIRDSLVNK